MQEIKFRSWDTESELWRYFTVDDLVRGFMGMFWHKCKNLCRYTEINDKKNNEIYEGDVIKFTGNVGDGIHECDKFSIVQFYEGNFHPFNCGFVFGKTCEVVGNIYENPELLG